MPVRVGLSPEDRAFRDDLSRFFDAKIPAAYRDLVDSGAEIPRGVTVDTQRILHAHGLAVPHWPIEWGGRAWSALKEHLWLSEMQFACVPPMPPPNVSLVGPVIAEFGTQDQKERFLPPTASLDIWWCQGFSEPEAGSDLASLRTTALRDGDHYRVNGQKMWTTLAQYADWIFCLVRTDPEAPRRQEGISFLLIDMKSAGITRRPIRMIDGTAEVNEVFFDDVLVPIENLVGEENRGWEYAKHLLGRERLAVSRIGVTKRMLLRAKQYALDVDATWPDPAQRADVRSRLALLENEVLALEFTVLRALSESERGAATDTAAVLKLRGTQLQQEVSSVLLELAGPGSLAAGGADGSGWPHWAQTSALRYLNTRKVSIYGGSNEIQRSIIASSVLGL